MVGYTDSAVNGHAKSNRKSTAEAVEKMLIGKGMRYSDRTIAESLGVSNRTVSLCRKKLESEGRLFPRVQSTQSAEACLREVCTDVIMPAPENDLIYDPIRYGDGSFKSLVEDVRANGVLVPIGCSRDGYIFDGHRRFRAVRQLRLPTIPVRIRPDVSYYGDKERFLRLLKSCNTQRVKSTLEQIREGIVSMDADEDHVNGEYLEYWRNGDSNWDLDGVEAIKLYGEKTRSEIRDKMSLRNAIVKVVDDNYDYWPLSDRKVFYLLLNITGLLRNDRLKTPFENRPECYNDVTDMVTRLRLDESIPFDSIGDETRPVVTWDTHKSANTFIEAELNNLFRGYWRDLLQSQANWIELLVEKNTIASDLRPVAAKYRLPMTSGRGYSSLPPRKEMVDRFKDSGREKLVLIVVSDFDPEGEDIPNSFGVSLRDDFDVKPEQLVVVKSSLTHAQVQTLGLHEGQMAKEDSSRYKRFVKKYGSRCWELESVPTETLRGIVEETVRSVVNLERFAQECEKEQQERAELERYRGKIRRKVADLK